MHAVQPQSLRQKHVIGDHQCHVAGMRHLAQGVGGAGDLILVMAGQGQADAGDLDPVEHARQPVGKPLEIEGGGA